MLMTKKIKIYTYYFVHQLLTVKTITGTHGLWITQVLTELLLSRCRTTGTDTAIACTRSYHNLI